MRVKTRKDGLYGSMRVKIKKRCSGVGPVLQLNQRDQLNIIFLFFLLFILLSRRVWLIKYSVSNAKNTKLCFWTVHNCSFPRDRFLLDSTNVFPSQYIYLLLLVYSSFQYCIFLQFILFSYYFHLIFI